MKKQTFKSFAFITLAAATTVACNPLSNMTKKAEQVKYTVTPDPLEMHGDSIDVVINGTIPPRFFNKKVSVEVTPTLNYEGGEKALDKIILVGEDSEVSGQKIPFEKGGSFSYNDKIAYVDGMQTATLNASAVGKYKGKEKSFPAREVATGTIVTPLWAMDDDRVILGKDNFTKVTPMSQSAVVNYDKNKSNVKSSELSDDDMKALKDWAAKMSANPMFVFKSTNTVAYASPEGEISLNANLADDRASSASRAVNSVMRKNKVEAAKEDGFYNNSGKGEDWGGFKSAMQASDIKDKNLILRVLDMYEDNSKREEEIRNLAATFEVIQEKILPSLRRSEISINGEMTSFSDEKITEFASSNPDTLSSEELLYAATLTDDMDKKLAIYMSFSKIHANDWRGPNNVGYIYAMQNKMEDAKKEFDKANSLSPNNPVINNNLGVYERANGNDEKAMELYAAAKGAGDNVGNNIGYIYMKQGNYVDAVSNYGNVNSFNAALAKTLNKDYQEALKTIDSSPTASTAESAYLKAVIAARMDNKDMTISNLKSAISKDASLKAKAKMDAEFSKYKENSEFQAAVN